MQDDKVIFSQLDDIPLEDENDNNEVHSVIQIGGIKLKGDWQLMCYSYATDENPLIFKACIHTSFITDNMVRLLPEHLDYSTRKVSFPADFSIDLIFEDFRP